MACGRSIISIAVVTFMCATQAHAGPLPKRVGACAKTTIKSVGTRLVDGATNRPIPGSGSAVSFVNGGYQVSYDTVPEVEQSRKGDPVRMCLVSIPKDCPKGDDRGRVYKTTNLRTHKSWSLPDAQHMCGGA
jgi:hypothetical protein